MLMLSRCRIINIWVVFVFVTLCAFGPALLFVSLKPFHILARCQWPSTHRTDHHGK